MNEKSNYKNTITQIKELIDMETGEILESNIKKHGYIANSKEEFLLLYTSLLSVFLKMSQAQIRVYAYTLRFSDGNKFSVDKKMRLDIAKETSLNERTVYNVQGELEKMRLLFKGEDGLYIVNPRYAFRGSTMERNNQLKAIIELGCNDC